MYFGAIDSTVTWTDTHDQTLFLQIRTGQWFVGNAVYTALWDGLEEGRALDTAIANLAKAGADPVQVRRDVERDLPGLLRAGILTRRRPGSPPQRLQAIVGDETQPGRREWVDSTDRIPRRVAMVGAVGFMAAMLLKPLPFRMQLEVLMAIRRACPLRPGLSDTRRLATAVKRAARWYPGRAECLEQSMGAFVAGALLRAAPSWCIGGRIVAASDDGWALDPSAPRHAWVESSDRTPVDYAEQDARSVTMLRV
jgi:hypothetical protein